ncbi:MAG TPA: fused MFS/spermidine synthase [Opitutaceae bacterium]|nr:fused MFS/spermidine synthase [Opitutaceae bacterium]
MKFLRLLPFFPLVLSSLPAAEPSGNYVENFDTTYNSLTVERRGSVVELRARSRRGEFLESAVDLSDPLRLVVDYTRTLYAGLFFQPKPARVLMIGLGGAGFHRLFTTAYPTALLQTVELDPKVLELTQSRLGFKPTDRTPVAIMDGRLYVKRSNQKWDWIILDAFRGGFVPPHLKTQEFYRECADRLADNGVFITNLHATTELYYADLKTLASVFPQVVLFNTAGRGNVIACAVKSKTPAVTDPAAWPDPATLNPPLQGRVDLKLIRAELIPWPADRVAKAQLLTDDFAPVEFLDVVKTNNTKE